MAGPATEEFVPSPGTDFFLASLCCAILPDMPEQHEVIFMTDLDSIHPCPSFAIVPRMLRLEHDVTFRLSHPISSHSRAVQ